MNDQLFWGAQTPRLQFDAPSRRTFGVVLDAAQMPTARARSAAPEAGALPIPTNSLT